MDKNIPESSGSPDRSGARKRFIALDGMRGVCAIVVFFYHLVSYLARVSNVRHGYIAVDCFFVISGFVIAASYEQRLRDRYPVMQFLRSRIRRLGPIYWFGLALGAMSLGAIMILLDHKPATSVLLYIFVCFVLESVLIPFVGGTSGGFVLNIPAWSIFSELVVNGLYARTVRWLSMPVLAFVVVAGWVATALIAMLSRASRMGLWLVSELHTDITSSRHTGICNGSSHLSVLGSWTIVTSSRDTCFPVDVRMVLSGSCPEFCRPHTHGCGVRRVHDAIDHHASCSLQGASGIVVEFVCDYGLHFISALSLPDANHSHCCCNEHELERERTDHARDRCNGDINLGVVDSSPMAGTPVLEFFRIEGRQPWGPTPV